MLVLLGGAHVQQTVRQVDVGSVKSERLAGAQAGDGQQPITVSIVAARNCGDSARAALISAWISAGEYRYGATRGRVAGSRSSGGISVAGSIVLR